MTTERQDEGLPERWSAQRKTEVVLRVIRGEALDEVATQGPGAAKREPKTVQSDAELVTLIREILAMSPFHSEGHRKVRVRLRQRGVQVGKARVLCLMRVHGLLAPTRPGHVHGDPA